MIQRKSVFPFSRTFYIIVGKILCTFSTYTNHLTISDSSINPSFF